MKLFFFLAYLSCMALFAAEPPKLELHEGDHICFIGNTTGAQMSDPGHNHFEALLYQRFPKLNLVVRNLCWPADEIALRPRTDGFGTPDENLAFSKADVVIAFFGFNESFKGPAGLEQFKSDLDAWIVHTQQQTYSGKSAPQIALVGPIAVNEEEVPVKGSQAFATLNVSLGLYSAAVKEVAGKRQVPFADVLKVMGRKPCVTDSKLPMTANGVLASSLGDECLASLLEANLLNTPDGAPSIVSGLEAAIEDKNFHWYHRHRIVDCYYVYGGRADLKFADGDQTNRDVLGREREVLDVKVANRDQRIWDIVQGKVKAKGLPHNADGAMVDSSPFDIPDVSKASASHANGVPVVSPPVDDSNCPPFLEVKTFFGTGKKKDAGQNTGFTSKTAEPDEIKFLDAEESKKHFKLAPGYNIDLFASEEKFPDLGNAVAMAFDARGRLWVSTFQSYPQWKPGGEMNDKIIILEDNDHDGKADEEIVFAEGLHLPIGFQFHNGGILVNQQRELLFLKDTNHDDKADIREQVLDGFDSADSHHVINSFTYGPGGDLYFQEGTFQHSQVETPWGPTRCVDAGTYRYEPRTQKLDVFVSYKYANPHGIAFDKWGQVFIADASGGANYFGTAFSGYLPYPEKHSTMKQWFPKRVRPTSGCEFVSSRHFPDEAQGRFLLNNCIGVQGILQHEVKEVGSGFEGKEIEPLLLSDDPLFRPVAMTFAPDGSLYVIDWAEALIGHMQYSIRDPLRDKSHGRIWRITYPGRPLVQDPKIAGETEDRLIAALMSTPELRTKERIRQELSTRPLDAVVHAMTSPLERAAKAAVERSHEKIPVLEEVSLISRLFTGPWARDELECLWLYQWQNEVNEPLLKRVLSSPEPEARAAATRVLCYWRDRVKDPLGLLMQMAKDEDPKVRLEAVRAASFFAKPSLVPMPESSVKAADVALELLNHEMDYYLDYALGETMRVLDVDVKALKNPKAIAYVVNRLSSDELAAAPEVEAIWQARVERKGFDPVKREAALSKLAGLRKQERTLIFTDAIAKLDTQGAGAQPAVLELGRMLLSGGTAALKPHRALLYTMSRNAISQSFTREVAYAAVAVADGKPDDVWTATDDDVATRTMLLNAIALIPDPAQRAAFQPKVAAMFNNDKLHNNIRRAALKVLPLLGAQNAAANFTILASHLKRAPSSAVAISALLQLPKEGWNKAQSPGLAKLLLDQCILVPADRRTSDEFLEAQQLGIDLATLMSDGDALKQQFRSLGVAVVLLKTLREQMIYDKLTFEVEAGKPVAIIMENDDIMPHNFVIVQPGALEEVAMKSQTMPPVPDKQGRLYIPESDRVLAATKMLEPGQKQKLTWTAPTQPGKVPFLCTFPGHWVRMKGEIVVK
ncbi:MAG: rane-bound dehydrogenase domain protein [Verrucomicrobiaceae bacterium]|nr:rane-bound dehydrogenase domain protein [Verrucomicrobiaceae bacterium]